MSCNSSSELSHRYIVVLSGISFIYLENSYFHFSYFSFYPLQIYWINIFVIVLVFLLRLCQIVVVTKYIYIADWADFCNFSFFGRSCAVSLKCNRITVIAYLLGDKIHLVLAVRVKHLVIPFWLTQWIVLAD